MFSELLEQKSFQQARVLLGHFLPKLESNLEYERTIGLLKNIPLVVFQHDFVFAKYYAEVLCGAAKLEELNQFIETTRLTFSIAQTALLQLEFAIGLQGVYKHEEAMQLLEQIKPNLKNEPLGIALCHLGWSLFEKQKRWETAFQSALPLLHGLELARALINFGHCLSQSGQHQKARNAWLEALPLVKHRAKTRAYILYNLAIVSQRQMLPDSEAYFLELERVSRNPKALDRRASALNGIAMQRRIRGEFPRAQAAYQEALRCAITNIDLLAAYIGLARVYEFAGKAAKSLAILEEALLKPELPKDQLGVCKASALLALGDVQGTWEMLEIVGDVKLDNVRWVVAFCKAELARRFGREADAIAYLQDLPIHNLHAREEAGRYPELVRLLAKYHLPTPQPLEYFSGITVRVEATNLLRVYVNQRLLDIAPTGKIATMLVYLLEHGKSSSTSALRDIMYPNHDPNDARKRLWDTAKALQKILGWKESVQNPRGAYLLDPNIIWKYDISEARARKKFEGEFLQGIDEPWVDDIRHELVNLSDKNEK